MELKRSQKEQLVIQGYSPAVVVSVLNSFLADALAKAVSLGGMRSDEVLFQTFLEAEECWSRFVQECGQKVSGNDFQLEMSVFFPRFSEWLKWKREKQKSPVM